MRQMRKMGSLSDLLGMIPGMGKLKQMKNMEVDETELVRIEAIINSMTPQERRQYTLINGSRRMRIARGSGPKVQEFERAVADFCGARYGVAANSGTSALHMACLAAGLGKGDEAITSPNTFVASA